MTSERTVGSPRALKSIHVGSLAWGCRWVATAFVLSALDPGIKAAIDVGWMSSFGTHIRRHVMNSIGLTLHIVGQYRYLDLTDLAALIAPRSLSVINGSRDQLFPPEGVRTAFEKIAQCFVKAGALER